MILASRDVRRVPDENGQNENRSKGYGNRPMINVGLGPFETQWYGKPVTMCILSLTVMSPSYYLSI